MPQEHSCDIVSRVNRQELRNALQQAQREISTRFDFRGTSASLDFEEATGLLRVSGDHAAQLKSVIDVVETKMAKRGVALKAFAWQSPQMLPSGGVKQAAQLQEGLSSEKAKAIVAAIKVLGLKVQPRIEGDSVRVVGKQVDDLQVVIAALKKEDFGVAIQADNYR